MLATVPQVVVGLVQPVFAGRIENVEVALRAHARGKGILLLTGHFGNFEVSTVAGISQFQRLSA